MTNDTFGARVDLLRGLICANDVGNILPRSMAAIFETLAAAPMWATNFQVAARLTMGHALLFLSDSRDERGKRTPALPTAFHNAAGLHSLFIRTCY